MKTVKAFCPKCDSPHIREVARVTETIYVLSWEFNEEVGAPVPDRYGDATNYYDAEEAVGYDCANCQSSFDEPRFVITEEPDHVDGP